MASITQTPNLYKKALVPLVKMQRLRNEPESLATQGVALLGRSVFLNPQNEDSNILQGPLRLLAGTITAFVLGVIGTFYHLGSTATSCCKGNGWEAIDHFGSALVDLFRAATLGIPAGLVFAFKPSSYDETNRIERNPASIEFWRVSSLGIIGPEDLEKDDEERDQSVERPAIREGVRHQSDEGLGLGGADASNIGGLFAALLG